MACGLQNGIRGTAPEDQPSDSAYYPVTINTAESEVTIEQRPKRIVILLLDLAEMAYSLGTLPVLVGGIPESSDQWAPWLHPEIKEAMIPVFYGIETLNFGRIALYKPDLFVASGCDDPGGSVILGRKSSPQAFSLPHQMSKQIDTMLSSWWLRRLIKQPRPKL